MGLIVTINEQTIYQSHQLDSDTIDLEFRHNLPLTVRFEVFGKMPEDTEIDDQGNIIRDKCVILDALCINGMWVKKWMLENKLVEFVPHTGQPATNNYFGQNGIASLTIPYDNLLEFWLDLMTVDH